VATDARKTKHGLYQWDRLAYGWDKTGLPVGQMAPDTPLSGLPVGQIGAKNRPIAGLIPVGHIQINREGWPVVKLHRPTSYPHQSLNGIPAIMPNGERDGLTIGKRGDVLIKRPGDPPRGDT